MLYQLMNKDVVVATYREEKQLDDYRYSVIERFDAYLPYGFVNINDWIDGRQIAKHRTSIEKLMRELGLTTRHDFIAMARCLSLTDTFWMKRADENISWNEVSLYHNPFDDVIARIAFDGTGMYGRQNSPTSPEYATSGSFAKCWVREGNEISLLKRGSSGYANAGFEPYSEVLASNVLDAASIDHVPYTIVNYHGKLASKCPLFTSEKVGFVSAHRFFDGPFDIEDMLAFCKRNNSEERFREMVVMDAVTANVDRHAGNYGFLVDNDTGEILHMAPLFDQNMACLPMMMEYDDFDTYLSMIGPKIGTTFVSIARALLTPSIRAKLIALMDFEYTDPGLGYPTWKLAAVNRLKDRMITDILA
ncbi:HipA protein [Adlercreutzia sp. ZJ138]|uniref:HipA protein n=1 Tax=Adlercreutzia sp. ZJ138 TaxID=2709405 RepID=UPI0013EBC1D4|nr:HipA protein [Adlercreutzia sp. ZJ138]